MIDLLYFIWKVLLCYQSISILFLILLCQLFDIFLDPRVSSNNNNFLIFSLSLYFCLYLFFPSVSLFVSFIFLCFYSFFMMISICLCVLWLHVFIIPVFQFPFFRSLSLSDFLHVRVLHFSFVFIPLSIAAIFINKNNEPILENLFLAENIHRQKSCLTLCQS